jgi:predicted nucleotidyltransferase
MVYPYTMDLLSVLFPSVRAEVLRLLFAEAGRELHLRELTRQSGLTLGTMQDELEKLSFADLVTSRRDGNRRCYQANASHPLFPDLQQLVLKTSGLRDVLVEALDGVRGVEIAFVFGSLASGAGQAGSDVDLMVIGDAGLRTLAPRLRAASVRLAREINPVTMTAAEFAKGRKKNPFLAEVLAKEKLFVKGGADELARLG